MIRSIQQCLVNFYCNSMKRVKNLKLNCQSIDKTITTHLHSPWKNTSLPFDQLYLNLSPHKKNHNASNIIRVEKTRYGLQSTSTLDPALSSQRKRSRLDKEGLTHNLVLPLVGDPKHRYSDNEEYHFHHNSSFQKTIYLFKKTGREKPIQHPPSMNEKNFNQEITGKQKTVYMTLRKPRRQRKRTTSNVPELKKETRKIIMPQVITPIRKPVVYPREAFTPWSIDYE